MEKLFAVFILICLLSSAVAVSEGSLFEDSFEDDSLGGAWNQIDGTSSEYSFTGSRSYDGSQSMEIPIPSDGKVQFETQSFEIEPGDVFYGYFQMDTKDSDYGAKIQLTDSDGYQYLMFMPGYDKARWRTDSSGCCTDNYGLNTGHWYEIKFEYNGAGEFTTTVTDITAGSQFGQKTQTSSVSGSGVKLNFYVNSQGSGKRWWDYVTAFESDTNNSPNITIVSPNNTNINPSEEATLEVKVNDSDSSNLNVTFYNASDNNEIDKLENIDNGTHTSTWNGFSEDENYTWYAEVTDGKNTVQSNEASFSTIGVTLNWNDNSSNEEGFRIYNNATGSMSKVGNAQADSESFTDYSEGLEFGKNYTYQLAAYNQYGESYRLEGYVVPSQS